MRQSREPQLQQRLQEQFLAVVVDLDAADLQRQRAFVASASSCSLVDGRRAEREDGRTPGRRVAVAAARPGPRRGAVLGVLLKDQVQCLHDAFGDGGQHEQARSIAGARAAREDAALMRAHLALCQQHRVDAGLRRLQQAFVELEQLQQQRGIALGAAIAGWRGGKWRTQAVAEQN